MNRKQRRAMGLGAAGAAAPTANDPAAAGQAMLAQALRHHQAGELAEAEKLYKQILKSFPGQPDALHFLGVLAHQGGDYGKAADLIQKALTTKPDYTEALNNLGNALRNLGRLNDAVEAYGKAIALKPGNAAAHNNLGIALREQEKLDDAAQAHQRAIELKPGNPAAHNNLGIVRKLQGRLEDAVECFGKAIAINPGYAPGFTNLGGVLRGLGRLDDALETHQKALALMPEESEMHYNFGIALLDHGKNEDAAARFEKAVELKPDYAEVHCNLGIALKLLRRFDDADKALRTAIEIDPDYAEAHNNLSMVLRDQGKIREAIEHCRRAMEIKPGYSNAHSNLVFHMNYDPSFTAAEIYEESRRWDQLHGRPEGIHQGPYANGRDPERRLRIGYVSPDFRAHSVAYFFEPVLAAHDRDAVEIFCYAHVVEPDEVTERIKGMADHWRSIVGVEAGRVAEQIMADGIDILVDLAGHTSNNRLDVFALRPAPVQLTWLGHPNTTGLDAMGYRLTDAIADPPGVSDDLSSEELVRLANGFHCYMAPDDAPDVGPMPALAEGNVTFGSFNNYAKVTGQVIEAWARILQKVPGSHLLIKSGPLKDEATCQRCEERFAAHGIPADRLYLMGFQEQTGMHLAVYGGIDLALDPFPYGGTTTTCEAMWMGVPVVTLRAPRHAGRVGASLLTRVGLEELVAGDVDGYVETAAALAKDWKRLGALRSGMRSRMAASPLCDGDGFAKDIEAAYRDMWRRWCEQAG